MLRDNKCIGFGSKRSRQFPTLTHWVILYSFEMHAFNECHELNNDLFIISKQLKLNGF